MTSDDPHAARAVLPPPLPSGQARPPEESSERSHSPSNETHGQRRWSSAPPQVTFSEHPAGRETLGAIAAESTRDPVRMRAQTQMYGDRISNAPGALSPQASRALDQKPEVSVSIRPAGRETYAIIEQELKAEGPRVEVGESPSDGAGVNFGALAIQQMRTFLIRAPLKAFEDSAQRRLLAERRLLPHLPVKSMSEVVSIDVRPWQEPGTLLVRVWCQVC